MNEKINDKWINIWMINKLIEEWINGSSTVSSVSTLLRGNCLPCQPWNHWMDEWMNDWMNE